MNCATPSTKLEEIFPSLAPQPPGLRPEDFRENRIDGLIWAFVLFFAAFAFSWAFYPIGILPLVLLVIIYTICRSNGVGDYKKQGLQQAWREWDSEKERLTEVCQDMQFVLLLIDNSPVYEYGIYHPTASISLHPKDNPGLIFRYEITSQPDWDTETPKEEGEELTEGPEPDIIITFPLARYIQTKGEYWLDLGRIVNFVQSENPEPGPKQVIEL